MITNHGCHSPTITVTTDTGGQNFYVNDLAKALVQLGYKVSILNRGGYRHPTTKKSHKGIIYYDSVWKKSLGKFCRLIYLEDKEKRFIRKESLKKKNLEQEKDFFFRKAKKIGIDFDHVSFISSHYWDAGFLGTLINKELTRTGSERLPHIWTPHSLGILKKDNYKDSSTNSIRRFNFPSRIQFEERVISEVDGVVSTSTKIKNTLKRYDARVKNHFWFPPGVDDKIYRTRKKEECRQGLKVLNDMVGSQGKDIEKLIKNKVFFVEVSRTADTKKKDKAMEFFTKAKNNDKAMLVVTADKKTEIYDKIYKTYKSLREKGNDNIFLIDEFLTKEKIAQIYDLADVYITTSVQEGWGMAVQEAAASDCAILSSDKVPFVTEVLKSNALVVKNYGPKEYSRKIDKLITHSRLRKKLAKDTKKQVGDNYSWVALSTQLIADMKKKKIMMMGR